MAAIAAALTMLSRDAATASALAADSMSARSAWHEKTLPKVALLDASWSETARLEALDAGV